MSSRRDLLRRGQFSQHAVALPSQDSLTHRKENFCKGIYPSVWFSCQKEHSLPARVEPAVCTHLRSTETSRHGPESGGLPWLSKHGQRSHDTGVRVWLVRRQVTAARDVPPPAGRVLYRSKGKSGLKYPSIKPMSTCHLDMNSPKGISPNQPRISSDSIRDEITALQ